MLDHNYATAFVRRQQAERLGRVYHRIETSRSDAAWSKPAAFLAAALVSLALWAVIVEVLHG